MQHHSQKPWKSFSHYDQLWLTIKYHHLLSTTINCHQQTSETSDLNLAYPCAPILGIGLTSSSPQPWHTLEDCWLPEGTIPKRCIPKINLSSNSPFTGTSCWISGRIGGSLGKSVGEKASLGYMWLGEKDPLILHLESNSWSPVIPKRVVVRSTPPHPGCNRHNWRVLGCDSRSWKSGRCHPGGDETSQHPVWGVYLRGRTIVINAFPYMSPLLRLWA